MSVEHKVRQAWERRDRHIPDEEHIERIANAFNLHESEVRKIIQGKK